MAPRPRCEESISERRVTSLAVTPILNYSAFNENKSHKKSGMLFSSLHVVSSYNSKYYTEQPVSFC